MKAIVTKISTSNHPNADKLQIGYCVYETVIVGIDTKDGELGIYFPCGLQLSNEFALANDLVRRICPATKQNLGGMFENNRRVRIQKIRGVKSHGFWCPISYLKHFGDVSKLIEGDQLDTFNGIPICNVYRSTRRACNTNPNNKKSPKSIKRKEICFPEHLDTKHLKHAFNSIKVGDELIVTLKMEGTSQRVGKVLCDRKLKWYEKFLQKIGVSIQDRSLQLVNGTRRVVLKDNNLGFHTPELRQRAFNKIAPYIDPHMIVYFEVVGYEPNGKPIMPVQSFANVKDKSIVKQYGENVIYSYGCKEGESEVYVYRICYVLPDGKTIDLSWDDIIDRCKDWGIKHVPEIARLKLVDHIPANYNEFDKRKELMDYIESLSDGPDLIGNHPREGVCVRINSTHWQVFKNKGWTYKLGADMVHENPDYIDLEEES